MTEESAHSGAIRRRTFLRIGAAGAAAVGLEAGFSLLTPALAERGLLSPDGVFGAVAQAWADAIYTEVFPTSPLILKPFRASGFITTAIGSIALTIALESVVRFGFGNELRGYDLPILRDWNVAGIRVGPQQVQNLLIAVVAMGLLFALLAFTRIGKAMRAVADNPMLAAI